MRSSKDIARRLRLRGYPGRDTFRRYYLAAGLVAVAAGLGVWLLLQITTGPRQFLPRPVSSNHALFGDRCENCHDAFQALSNDKCLGCHPPRVHASNEVQAPDCAHCHAEHRSTDVFVSVSARACVECHGNLATQGKDAVVERQIASFAAHPEFVALREGRRDHDPAKLRFNHRIHLGSTQIPEDEKPLFCAKCHRLQPDGRRMQSIVYETNCKRCHLQIVDGPTGSIEALHEDPATVREALRRQLLDAAASIGTVTSEELRKQLDKLSTPNPELLFPRALPGRVDRSGFSKERLSVAALEQDLYKPFVAPGTSDTSATASLFDLNKGCYLCHLEGKREDPESPPVVAATAIPARWLERSDFSHQRHELMPCAACHAKMHDSRDTADTNLPDKAACQRCHIDGERESAGTVCMSCHLYHDTSKISAAVATGKDAKAPQPLRSHEWWSERLGAAAAQPPQ